MTTAQFITAIEAKPQFRKWAMVPRSVEKIGDIEKWNGIAYITTPDGTNTYNVWFMVDTATGEASWQNLDTMEPEKNATEVKRLALEAYLKATFAGYFINRADYVNNWAEADVFTVSGQDLAKSTVLVFKQGSNPIAHRKIV
jgi:hypothetical protein